MVESASGGVDDGDGVVIAVRALVQAADSTGERVRFLGIDTDDLRGAAQAFAARYQIPYPLSFDPERVVAAHYRQTMRPCLTREFSGGVLAGTGRRA